MNRRHLLISLAGAPLLAQTPAAPAPVPPPPPELDWHDAKKFTVEGLGFRDLKSPYDRFPGRAEGVVPAPVWNLSTDSSGVAVRFVAGSTAIHARWNVTGKSLAGSNITAVASSGLDLYARNDAGKWRWVGIGTPTKLPENTGALVTGIPATPREFMVYLPLRNQVSSLEIGVIKGSTITAAPARAAGRKSIVFYGTSITHGIGASRAGMTHVAMLGRRFDREVINLGFSGNGRMEPEVVKFVAELDPAVFVLDCLPNMNAKQVAERIVPGVKLLREAHPQTPILLVEDRFMDNSFLVQSRRDGHHANHAALREAFTTLQAAQVPNLHYLKADDLLGHDGEATVDGSHPTDLGFTRQAAEFERVLRPILR
ncbi:MAG: hypothetical protein EBY17_05975 [Acidobacteriia bacterium]|jgi:hypothetical protein|nr:hypothetical protein [Terriglobia bacterium]